MSVAARPNRIVLGIDFGTTSSCAAYSYSGSPDAPDEINVVHTPQVGFNYTTVYDRAPPEYCDGTSGSSPSQPAQQSSSVVNSAEQDPSKLQRGVGPNVSSLRHSIAESVRSAINRVIPPTEPPLQCLKLLLESEQQMPSYIYRDKMRKFLSRHGKSPSTAVADLLRELFEHCKEDLVKRYGELIITTTPLEVMLSFPAFWSEGAKALIRKAGEQAGIPKEIRLISEPEAAAVYALSAMQPNSLQVGDNFIVCDAGGGTVDVISYELTQIQPIRIEESLIGAGSFCGSAFLNMKFEEHVRSKFGNPAFKSLCREHPDSWQAALTFFEDYVKRAYDPEAPTDFYLPFPGVADKSKFGIGSDFLTFATESAQELFEPILKEAVDLVRQQLLQLEKLQKRAKSIILVGGFGQSECLYKACRKAFCDDGNDAVPPYPGIEVSEDLRQTQIPIMRLPNAETAVARGAVLSGIAATNIVVSRKSRAWYGSLKISPYIRDVDDPRQKHWDQMREQWFADHQIRWFISKGATSYTEPLLPVHYSYIMTRRNPSKTVIIEKEVVVSYADDHPPSVYKKNNGIKKLCNVTVKIDSFPSSLWTSHKNSAGKSYKCLRYDWGMQLGRGGLIFDLLVGDELPDSVVTEYL